MAGCTGTPESDKMWLPLKITVILINHCLVSVLVLMLPCLIWMLHVTFYTMYTKVLFYFLFCQIIYNVTPSL